MAEGKTKPRRKRKEKATSATFSAMPSFVAMLERIADAEGLSFSALIRKMLVERLELNGKRLARPRRKA